MGLTMKSGSRKKGKLVIYVSGRGFYGKYDTLEEAIEVFINKNDVFLGIEDEAVPGAMDLMWAGEGDRRFANIPYGTPLYEMYKDEIEVLLEKLRKADLQNKFLWAEKDGGKFQKSLVRAIKEADSQNLKKLFLAYPRMVNDFSLWKAGVPFEEWSKGWA